MAAKDTKSKEFLSDNARFADLCNYYLFDGRQVLKAEDRLTPVITLTLYWGADAWDGPRSIHEMLLPTEESLLPYVADYKLNLIVPNEITDFQKFKTSLGAVLAVIKVSNDKEKMNQLITTNAMYSNLENEAVQTLNMFAGLKLEEEKEDKTMDMCKAWVDQKQSGIEEGESLTRIRLIMKKIKKGLSLEETADMLEEEPEVIREIWDAVNANPGLNEKEIYQKIKK